MIASKHITKIVAVITALAVLLCLTAMVFAEDLTAALGGEGVTMEYESALFDTSEVMTVNIIMDESEWQNMLDNAMSEVYYQCDVEINGKMFYRVGIRPKGNTSLSTIAMDSSTNRYSFKLEFDQYVSGQTCYGLDKLILNNNYADTTNMKEALIYDMYAYIGADASLYNYARISVNGDYWGVYLALEAVEDSFLLRNYGVQSGELYKPESMNMGGGFGGGGRENMDFGDMDPEDMSGSNMNFGGRGNRGENGGTSSGFTQFGSTNEDASSTGTRPSMGNIPNGGAMPDMGEMPEGFDPSQFEGEIPDMSEMFGGGGKGGFSMGGSGANLNYTDDSLDSYSTIWEGAVGGTSDADHKRVVTALKNIAEGTSLETYMDIENLLKYMAVHIFSVNDDSLSGSMAHNYYLYEEGGQLNIIPWDYNLAFGGMGMGGGGFGGSSDEATNTVNEAIDDAFSGTKFFDTLMANEEYHAEYYEVMRKLVDEYLLGDGFESFYNRTRAQIDALVETDPNAFYTYEEYLTAVDTFYELVKLRGQSIDGQLNGTIPSRATEQRNSDTLIDASHLDLDTLGSMSMGGGGFGGGGRGGDFDFSNFGGRGDGNMESDTDGEITGTSANITPPSGDIPEGFDLSEMGGALPEGFDPSQFGGDMPEGFGSMQGETTGNTETPDNGDATQGGDTATGNEAAPGGDFSFDRNNIPDMGNMANFSGTGSSSQNTTSNLIMLGICVVLLVCALLFAKFYRRTPRRR